MSFLMVALMSSTDLWQYFQIDHHHRDAIRVRLVCGRCDVGDDRHYYDVDADDDSDDVDWLFFDYYVDRMVDFDDYYYMAVNTFPDLARCIPLMLMVCLNQIVVMVIELRTLTLKEQVINLDRYNYNFWDFVVDLGYLGVLVMNCYATSMVMSQNLNLVDLHLNDVDLL